MSRLLCSIMLFVWMLRSQRILKDSFSVKLYLENIKAFLSTNIPMHSPSHPVMLLFVFFMKRFRTFRNNVSDCLIIGFTHPHLGSFLVPSIFVLMLLVLMHWSWALVIRDSVFLFKWSFHCQFHDFTSAIPSVSLMNWSWSILFFKSWFLLICCLCLVIFGGSATSRSPDDLHAAERSFSWLFYT